MAKQVIIQAVEEAIGEYVLNIDKEHLKIAFGKIKLENVQLDGDVLGGHVLGSIGLSGFGILSCWAKSVIISIPLKNLEKEVTKIELQGVHLLCLPLLPATAHQAFGAGSNLDPRCTLRTRAKRTKLVRFEKNYLQGRIPGEGPIAGRILRAVRNVEREQKKKSRKQQTKGSNNSLFPGSNINNRMTSTSTSVKNDARSMSSFNPYDSLADTSDLDVSTEDLIEKVFLDEMDGHDSNVEDGLNATLTEKYQQEAGQNQEEKSSVKEHTNNRTMSDSSDVTGELPKLPRDWKVKLREKIMRNMEASVHDVHFRCEVFEGGLDFCHPDHRNQRFRRKRKDEYDQRAFSFGGTLDSFVMRTANEKWKIGSHEKTKFTEENDNLGPNPYDARHNKIHSWNNFCMYWDDDPPFLISESELVKTPGHRLSSEKFHSKIAAAMRSLVLQQEPGKKIRESLVIDGRRHGNGEHKISAAEKQRSHEYVFEGVNGQARQRISDRTEPGPISCQFEFLPLQWDFKFRPHQFIQYTKLKSAMLSQRRFDTMLRQRPAKSPLENPREWWKYAFGCITTRPNSRSWNDVVQITRNRDRYISLVVKKLVKGIGGSGFHRGLSESESLELLELEDLLPIEALLSFHLLALREYTEKTANFDDSKSTGKKVEREKKLGLSPSRGRILSRGNLTRIFTRSRSKSQSKNFSDMGFVPIPDPPSTASLNPACFVQPEVPVNRPKGLSTLLEAMTMRLGRKVWKIHFKIYHITFTVTLLSASNQETVRLRSETAGTIKFFGRGKLDFFFDVTRFQATDCQSRNAKEGIILAIHPPHAQESPRDCDDESIDLSVDLALTPSFTGDNTKQTTAFMDLPPPGVVCRLAAARDRGSTKLSFSAHPATLLWTRQCFDAVAEFFGAPSTKMQTELTSHLKHVATPLARKAHLAFLSQSTLQIYLNIAAPKIWIPLLYEATGGALFLDAGNLRYCYNKQNGQTDVSWNLEASDIQVNYVRWQLSEVQEKMSNQFSSTFAESPKQGITSIIRPIQINAAGGVQVRRLETKIASGESLKYNGSIRFLDISISAIALNLVDVEVLARAIGKWYSQGFLSVRGRVSSKVRSRYEDQSAFSTKHELHERAARNFQSRNSTPQCLSLTIEKLEMALEGHSKFNFSDEKSIESHETSHFGQFASPTRTYIVEVFNLCLERTKNHDIIATKIMVADASIVQLKAPSEYTPMKARHEACESQYCILERGIDSDDDLDNQEESPVLSVAILHDGTIHLDEVDIDIDPVILRVTPTSLKDCTKGIRKIAELVQLITRAMEHKVHEEGRKARRRDYDKKDIRRPGSPAISVTSTLEAADAQSLTQKSNGTSLATKYPLDSSLIVKVTVKDGCILAGRPTFSSSASKSNLKFQNSKQSYSFAVVQLLSNALVMFQSIENADASGSKTLHVSLDNLCGNVDTEFEKIPIAQASPMIGPSAAEFRLVNATENLGCPVSNDVSIDCEKLRSSLTPNDLSILISIVEIMRQRLRGIQDFAAGLDGTRILQQKKSSFLPLLKYQKCGTGIATNIRIELQKFSFVVLRTFQTRYGAPEFLSFNLNQLKATLSGCVSALSGDCTTDISVDFYNSDVNCYEHAVEPFPMKLSVDQMPNELILDASTENQIQLNLTGIFLRDFSELDFGSLQRRRTKEASYALTPTNLRLLGLRRATESHSVEVHNVTGIDIEIDLIESEGSCIKRAGVKFDSFGPGLIKDRCYVTFDSLFENVDPRQNLETSKFCLKIPASSTSIIGERDAITDLPVTSSAGELTTIHLLRPDSLLHNNSHHESDLAVPDIQENDENSLLTFNSISPDYAYYNAEPVVEWCMQNQRLRSSTIDLYSLDRGSDLLSSSFWSPEEDYNVESIGLVQSTQGLEATCDGILDDNVKEVQHLALAGTSRTQQEFKPLKSNWLRPYLKNDSPEWTDMTCILRTARERVMLPDNNWMWVNDWTVDVSGEFEESSDADGYEYSADFETFTRTRRFYVRGDSCRRRRWTRTRIVKPPPLGDPRRPLKIVWKTFLDEMGNFKIDVKSHITIHNSTSTKLFFFVYSPSWNEEKLIGSADPNKEVCVPILLASAVYLRVAKKRSNRSSSCLNNFDASDRIMMLPTSYNSESLSRTSIKLNDVSETHLHFLLNVKSKKDVVDIYIEPVLKVVNLLPCQLECHFGEVLRPSERRQADTRSVISRGKKLRIANVETMQVASGKEGKCVALNPGSKPHISLRVPGYRWSAWQRIVNRKANSLTWRPTEAEEEIHICANRGDTEDYAEEFKTIIHFDRLGKFGDPLVLILSVEAGHSPTLRVYSQYWVVDKTRFGCRFCDNFSDLMGTLADNEYSRRSYLPKDEMLDPSIQKDLSFQGHQWSIGMSGMSLYFSLREKIAISIETGSDDDIYSNGAKKMRSKWTSPMDISNVMPKSVFSVDEVNGPRRFELAMSVTVCPGIFARSKQITFIPRYLVVNLLKRELVIAQDGCLKSGMLIPSQSSVPFHWERQYLPPKVRLGAPTMEEKDTGEFEESWTNGVISIEKIGITSIRLPTAGILPAKPMIVQTEIRLATKEQNSAVVIVIWSANEKSNPLYLLRNRTKHTILCRQPLQEEQNGEHVNVVTSCGTPTAVTKSTPTAGRKSNRHNGFECGSDITPIVRSFLGLDPIEEFVWVLRSGDVACFGFDDPEKPHILEWSCMDGDTENFNDNSEKVLVEIDAMGSSSSLKIGTKEVICQIKAEHSTKVAEFSDFEFLTTSKEPKQRNIYRLTDDKSERVSSLDENEDAALSLRFDIPLISISVIDNAIAGRHGREILLAQFDGLFASFSQSREGYHEIEFRLLTLQVDNHVPSSIHPVLIFCPKHDFNEPFIHLSAVRRLQEHTTTYVFRYAAFRMLEVSISLDRRTAENVARFIEPVLTSNTKTDTVDEAPDFVSDLTTGMLKYSQSDRFCAPTDLELMFHSANSGRIYFEQLHLHPIRIALTFSQEWMEFKQGDEVVMLFQFIRGMASIADAPLTFTSFVVGHVFESPQALLRVIGIHYSSQLTKQIFSILGHLAILGAPADFISNVGTGVRDFFYEPIQGAVHGPRQFIEGLEAGTQSLARGVFVGVVRGAANVAEIVNHNLALASADDDFIIERKNHQRMLTDAMSRGATNRRFSDSVYLAAASVARGIKSGARGIVEQPTRYASKHGPVGLVKGVGKAMVGAIVKPVVGVGDAAALLMNHVSDATSNKQVIPKIPKRLRRALPSRSSKKPNCVFLKPFDDRAGKAQRIVAGGESCDDVYIGHVYIPSHLIIASEQCLWAIDRLSREAWCVSWEEVSHFGRVDDGVRVVVFSQTGLKPYVFQVVEDHEVKAFQKLLMMQFEKMGNAASNLSELKGSSVPSNEDFEVSMSNIPGIKTIQKRYIFGKCNNERKRLASTVKDEIDLIERCFGRVKRMSSEMPKFFMTLDEEAWTLVSCWGQVFSGLSSRRCIAACVINGTGGDIQIKSTKLLEGGSPCYSIPTKEFDSDHGVLHAGGIIIFFGWSQQPSLLQPGNVFMHIETNAFTADLAHKKSRDVYAEAFAGFELGFLEKSYDDHGWWAKYWLLIRKIEARDKCAQVSR